MLLHVVVLLSLSGIFGKNLVGFKKDVLFAFSTNDTDLVQQYLREVQGYIVVDIRRELDVLEQVPKLENYLIIVEEIKNFVKFISYFRRKSGFNPRGIFLIHYLGEESLDAFFNYSWNNYLLTVSIINKYGEVFSYSPIREGNCGLSFTKAKGAMVRKSPITHYFGCPLKVLPLPIQPYVIDVKNPKNPGFEVTMLHTLAERLNFTVQFVENKFKHWGYKLNNDSYTAMMNDLTSGKADLLIGMVISNHSLEDDFDNVNAVVDCSINFFIPIALPVDSWKNFTAVFDPKTWILIFTSTLAMMVTWWLYGQNNFASSALTVWGGLFSNIDFNPASWRFRGVVLIWLLFSFLISSIYQGSLTSFLTKSVYEHQISNLKEMIESDLSYGGYSALRAQFNESGNPVFLKLHRNWVDCDLTEKCINRSAEKRDFGVLKNNRQLDYLMPKYSFASGKPKLFMIKKPVRTVLVCHTFEKGFPLFQAYQNMVLKLQENGLVDKWKRDVARAAPSISENSFAPLVIRDLKIAFVLLGIGNGVALMVFLVEILVGKM